MDYLREYKDHCLTCEYYNPTTNWSEIHSSKGFWCSKYGWCDPYDKCSSYHAAGQSSSFLEACMEAYMKKKRFYIVTTVCDILKLPYDCEYRKVFADVLNNKVYNSFDADILFADYGKYGLEVAKDMIMWYHNETLREDLLAIINKEVIPRFDHMLIDVKKGDLKRAITKYIVLVRRLMEIFDIEYILPNNDNNKLQDNEIVFMLKKSKQ